MEKIWIVLPIGNHGFNNDYICQCARERMDYETAKKKMEAVAKYNPETTFVLFQSFIQITYKPEILKAD